METWYQVLSNFTSLMSFQFVTCGCEHFNLHWKPPLPKVISLHTKHNVFQFVLLAIFSAAVDL